MTKAPATNTIGRYGVGGAIVRSRAVGVAFRLGQGRVHKMTYVGKSTVVDCFIPRYFDPFHIQLTI